MAEIQNSDVKALTKRPLIEVTNFEVAHLGKEKLKAFKKVLGLPAGREDSLPEIKQMPSHFLLPASIVEKIAELNKLSFLSRESDGRERSITAYLRRKDKIVWGKVLQENFIDEAKGQKGIKRESMEAMAFIDIHTHPSVNVRGMSFSWPYTGSDLGFLIDNDLMMELISGHWGVYGLIKSGDFDFDRWKDDTILSSVDLDRELRTTVEKLREMIRLERGGHPFWQEYTALLAAFSARYGIVFYSSNAAFASYDMQSGEIIKGKPVQSRKEQIKLIKIEPDYNILKTLEGVK